MSLPPNQTPQNPVPNRTPFDDDLLQDPNAPRHTQPLPSQPLPSQTPTSSTRSALPSGPSTVGGAPTLPRQVVLNDDTATPKTGVLPNKIPLSAIVGLAMVGGALAVILISSAFRRAVSPSPTPPAVTLSTPTPDAPHVVMVPPIMVSPTTQSPDDLPTPNTVTPGTATPSTEQSPVVALDSTPKPRRTPRALPDETPNDASTDGDNSDATNNDASKDNSTSNARDQNGAPASDSISENGVYRSRRHNYSIQAPSGFRLMQKGRRTNWHGPDDTKLLVEVGGAGDVSPRESWEKLERTLQRKYGAKYQSKGIRETTINGKQAAVWEFELETKSGKVRKMDVAIHDGTKGFAVLATAPVDKFETWRPQFDKAIQSLQIESDATPTPDGY